MWRTVRVLALAPLVALVLLNTHLLQRFDSLIYDEMLRHLSPPTTESMVLVAIDEASLLALGQWPWPRQQHAELIERLKTMGANTLVFDVLFVEPSDPLQDAVLKSAIAAADNVVLPVYIGQMSHSGQIFERMPLPAFAEVAAGMGHVHYQSDTDGISRGVYLKEGLDDAFWFHIAWVALQQQQSNHPIIQHSTARNEGQRAEASLVQIAREQWVQFPFIDSKEILTVSYIDVLKGQAPARLFKDRVVFVGATAPGLGDSITTPFSGRQGELAGVHLNMAVYAALEQMRMIHPLTSWKHQLFVIAIVLLACGLALFVSPRKLLVLIFLLVITLHAAAFALLANFYSWLPTAAITIALLFIYPLASLQRLDRALRFLRQELDVFRKQPSFFQQANSSDDIASAVSALSAQGLISVWKIVDAQGETLTCSALNTETSQSLPVYCEEQTLTLHYTAVDSAADAVIDTALATYQHGKTPPHVAWEVIESSTQQLREAHQKTLDMYALSKQSLAGLQSGMMLLDATGRFLYKNEAIHTSMPDIDILAADQQQIFTLLDRLQMTTAVQLQRHFTELLQKQIAFEQEVVLTDERVFWWQANPLPVSGKDIVFCVLITDVSAIRQLERSRIEAIRLLSHDMRSPLVSILALLEKGDQLDSFALLSIESYTLKTLRYAESFLHISRAEQLQVEEFHPVDMLAVLDSAMAETMPRAEARSIILHCEYSEDTCWVMGQQEMLERSLVNMIDNSIKYSPENTTIELSLSANLNWVELTVSDQGIGIEPELLDKMFGGFQRSQRSEVRSQPGVGLGLRLVDLVAKRHGGEVLVESVFGEGSQFTLRLPFHDIENLL